MSSVIVVGAGVGGLAAAKRLQDAGHSAVVLEVRDRIGGRVFTDDGLDVGAQWIHGNHPEFEAYVASIGVPTVNTDFTKMRFDGADVSQADYDDIISKMILALAWDAYWRPNVSMFQTVSEAYAQGHFAPHSYDVVDLFAIAGIDVEWASDAVNVPAIAARDSAPWFWDADAWASSAADNTAFPGGFSQVVDALSLGLDIHLNTQVTSIGRSNTGVVVTTPTQIYSADYCICTLPLGVLKAGVVSFAPELPWSKRGAIQRMGVGLLNKVILQFPEGTQLPAADVLGSHAGGGGRGACSIWVNISNVTGKPTLVGWLTGTYASVRETWPDADIVTEALQRFPELPQPVRSSVTRWGQDPYARGSYSSFDMHSWLGDRAKLREPTGRLLWAGEHTMDTGFASVPGAWESGRREADRIINGEV